VNSANQVPAATGGSLHFYPSAVTNRKSGNGQCMVPSVASAFTGQIALLVTSAAANEAVLKVREWCVHAMMTRNFPKME